MENFCEDLKKYVWRIIDYEKKEITPLTKKKEEKHKKQNKGYICKEGFSTVDDNK